jgi:hypothetical protein
VLGLLPAARVGAGPCGHFRRSAVQVIERRAEIPVPMPPARRDWPRLLEELARQIDDGRVYDRDLDGLSSAPTAVLEAMGAGPMCVAEGPVRADGCARENVPQRRGDTSTTLSPHLLSSAAHRPARLASVRPGSFEGDAAGIDVTGGVT